jgi:hypothetical protein
MYSNLYVELSITAALDVGKPLYQLCPREWLGVCGLVLFVARVGQLGEILSTP